jgi:serine/threonine protein kinase
LTLSLDSQFDGYDFSPGKILAKKYEIVSQVGAANLGELYWLNERSTGIERTAKFFYPHLNPKNRTANSYAKKLHKLRDCNILMQYHTQETITFQGRPVTFLVSEFIEGEFLGDFVKAYSGARLPFFEALHLLHALAKGVDKVHAQGEYQGALHLDNILIRRKGLSFEVKLLDLDFHRAPRASLIREEVCDLIRIFYVCLGGAKTYGKLPPEVKAICCGLKKSLINEKFKTAGQLRLYLETMHWFVR